MREMHTIGQSRAYRSLVTSERLRNRGSGMREEWCIEERKAGRNRKGKIKQVRVGLPSSQD